MHPLLTFLVALACAPSFANQTTGPGQRHLYRGARALGQAKPAAHDPPPPVQHARMVQLMARHSLRYLMFVGDSISPAHAEFGFRYPVLTDDVTGPFVQSLVRTEVAMAKRYGLDFTAVCAETDLLLDLVTESEDTSAAAVTTELRAREHHSLGPAYDGLFLRRLRHTKVLANDPTLPRISSRFLVNLADRLQRTADAGRAAVESAEGLGSNDGRVVAWLRAELPRRKAPSAMPAVPGAESVNAASDRMNQLRHAHTNHMAECLRRMLE